MPNGKIISVGFKMLKFNFSQYCLFLYLSYPLSYTLNPLLLLCVGVYFTQEYTDPALHVKSSFKIMATDKYS